MHEPRTKSDKGEEWNDLAVDVDQPIPSFFVGAIEQLCSAMSANGAAVALRDPEGLRCFASIGEAPPVGSRLQPDSLFTKECLESGRVVICDDAENDSRIEPSIARGLNLRSAVAVPILAPGYTLGLIEVFSSRPSDISPADVAALEKIAGLLAIVIAPRLAHHEEQELDTSGCIPVFAPPPALLSADEPSVTANWFPAAALESSGWLAGTSRASRRLRVRLASRRIVHRLIERITAARAWIAEVLPTVPPVATWKFSVGTAWLIGAVALSFLALLSLSRESFVKTTNALPGGPDTGVPSARMKLPVEAKVRQGSKAIEIEVPKHSSTPNIPDPSVASASTKVKREAPASETQPTHLPAELGGDMALGRPQDFQFHQEAVAVDSKAARELSNSADTAAAVWEESSLESSEVSGGPSISTPAAPAPLPLPIEAAVSPRPNFVLDRTLKGHSNWVTGVAFSSDGRRLASGSWDQTVKFWDVPTGRELNTVGSKIKEVQALAVSRDGRWLAAENSNDTVTLWDASTGKQIRMLPSDKPLGAFGKNWIYSIAFSPDGHWLASGVDDRTVRVWDTTTGRAVRDLTALRRSVIYAAFSPDGRSLASGEDDKSIRIWDVSTGKELQKLSGHKKPIYAVAFSPNGRLLASAGAEKTIRVWDIAAGHELRALAGHENAITSLAFSPDGRWLASGSWDKTVRIWNVETGREVQVLVGHAHSIYSVAFDSSGRWLASGSEDGTINLWRLNGVQSSLH